MKLPQPLPLRAIAERIGARVVGDADALVTGLNEIHKVQAGDLTFVDVAKYYDKSLHSAATFILIDQEVTPPAGKSLLVHPAPFDAYNSLTQHFQPFEYVESGIDSTVTIGEGTHIEPGVQLGKHITIGRNCLIRAGVVINSHTEIGDNVIIHANTVVGGDAFYYKKRPEGNYDKWHTCGRVIIHDDVEIGALCSIDKGVSGDTIIGQGTKIDNQCHLGHGVVVGKHCLMAAKVAIAGKTILGDHVTLYGQVGIAQSLHIGDKAVVLAQSGVAKSLPGGQTYMGSPAAPYRTFFKEQASLRKLPGLLGKLQRLVGQ